MLAFDRREILHNGHPCNVIEISFIVNDEWRGRLYSISDTTMFINACPHFLFNYALRFMMHKHYTKEQEVKVI